MRCLLRTLGLCLLVQVWPGFTIAQSANVGVASPDEHEGSTPSDERVRHEGTLSPRLRKRTRQQWDPDTYKLHLDSSGLSVSPSQASRRRPDARLRRYRQGLIASSVVVGIGAAIIGRGAVVLRNSWEEERERDPWDWEFFPHAGPITLISFGALTAFGGIIGMAVSGSKLGVRKQELRELKSARGVTRKRAKWSPAQWKLAF